MTTNTDITTFKKEPGIYYCACAENERSYVGQSVNVYNRINYSHIPRLRGNRHSNRHMQNSWNKYGEESFRWVVLEYCSEEMLNDRESYWIKHLCTEFPNGFNLTNGGDNLYRRSEESRRKMRESWDEERKKSQTLRNKSIWASETKRRDMCNSMKEAWTDERRAFISKQKKEQWASMTEEARTEFGLKMKNRHYDVSGDNNPRARTIKCVETDEVFTTIKEAAITFGINYSTLKSHLHGNLVTAGGYRFKYID